jgi:hypothetical protein
MTKMGGIKKKYSGIQSCCESSKAYNIYKGNCKELSGSWGCKWRS